VGQHFPLEILFDVFAQRDVLGVTQIGIWLRLALEFALGCEHDLASLVLDDGIFQRRDEAARCEVKIPPKPVPATPSP
jgi:hypothetical protein